MSHLNKKFIFLIITFLMLLIGIFTLTQAGFNEQINYQGKLTDNNNIAVPDGDYNMEFRLYTTSTGGTPIWTETATGANRIPVRNGLFSHLLGSINPLSNVNFNQTLWLGVNIGGTTTPPQWDGEMTPRKRLGAVPGAFEAKRLGGYTWASPGAIGSITPNTGAFTTLTVTATGDALTLSGIGANINFSGTGPSQIKTAIGQHLALMPGGNVGIGTTTPPSLLSVGAGAQFQVNSEGDIIRIRNIAYSWPTTTTIGGFLRVDDAAGNLSWTTLAGAGGVMGTGTAGQVAFWTGTSTISGTSTFIWDNTLGRLGIGTATPTQPLHVVGNIRFTGVSRADDGTAGAPAYTFEADLDTGLWRSAANTIAFTTEGTTRLTLSTTTLTSTLPWRGPDGTAAAPALSFSAETDVGIYRGGTDNLRLVTAGTDRLTIDAAGRVGIGTTTPVYPLDIMGALRLQPTTTVPTGAGGVIYYDSTLDKFRCYQAGAWRDCIGYSPMRDIIIVDEFLSGLTTSGNIGDLGWLMAAGSVSGQPPIAGHIGILRLLSPAAAGTRGVLQLSPGTPLVMIIPGGTGDVHIRMVVRNAAAPHANLTMRIGLLSTNAAGEVPNAIMFRASGTGNWFAVTRAGGVETATNCGVAQATTFRTFEIFINPAFNNVRFVIDGTTCATHTTNIPTVALSPTFKADTADAVARGFDIDRFVLVRSPLIAGADLAEYYYTTDDSLGPGDVVSLDPSLYTGVKKSEQAYDSQLLGVISTEPGLILGGTLGPGRAVLVSLLGRVPLKVSTKNGPIEIGDYLTSSDIPGVAMKATKPGRVIGIALESLSETDFENCGTENSLKIENCELKIGKILVFINPHWSIGSLTEQGILEGQQQETETSQTSLLDKFTLRIKKALEKLGLFVKNGITQVKELVTEKITAKKAQVENLEVLNKIQLRDQATGEIYCTWIENGEWQKVKGECDKISNNPTQPNNEQPNNEQPNNEQSTTTQSNATQPENNQSNTEQSNIEND